MSTLPILYSFRRCPYAMRARLALLASGMQVQVREVVLRDKPQELLDASAKGTVPVLVLPDGTVIDESLDIMRFALEASDPEGWLQPDNGSLEEVYELIAANDGPFKGNLDRYKYPNRYEGANPVTHRTEGLAHLVTLESRLSGPYLFGQRFSLADAALLPFVRQFANTDRGWFDALPLTRLHKWLGEGLSSPRFLAIMKKLPKWVPEQEPVTFPFED